MQLVQQHPAGQIVDRELQLVAIRGHPAIFVGKRDPGVVDQQIQFGIVPRDFIGEILYRLHGRKVGGVETRGTLAAGLDFIHQRRAALCVASMHNHMGAVGGQRQRQLAPQPVRGTGNEHRLALVGQGLVSGPSG